MSYWKKTWRILDTLSDKSVVYIAPSKASFVMLDIEQLSKQVDVHSYFFTFVRKAFVPFAMIKLFFFLVFGRKRDFLVSFGGYHSFVAALVARLRGVKCLIILNGTDVVAIPEFNYGHLRKGVLKYCCIKSYEWATKLLPVSDSLMYTVNDYCFESKPLGLNAILKRDWEYQVIPNGFDANFWQTTRDKNPNSVITVASSNRLPHKGVDLLIELANSKPDFSFFVAGVNKIEGAPENVVCLGYLTPAQLRDAYSSSVYYFQLSIWEGFGCAICEAMLCGCIPIVSNVNMLPEIAGNKQLVLKERSAMVLEKLLDEIEHLVINNEEFRNRIAQTFPIDQRVESLVSLLG